MTNWLKKVASIGLVTSSLLFLPGCWDYQKINNKAMVYGISVDPIQDHPELLSFTFQIPLLGSEGTSADDTSSVGTDGGGGNTTSLSYRNFTVDARGMSDALAKAQLQYSKAFYLSNLQTVVMNDQLNAEQIQGVMSELTRSTNVDKLAYLFFSKQPAREIFESKSASAPADAISEFLAISLKSYGYTTRTHLWEFWRDLKGNGIDPQVPLVKTTDEGFKIYGLLGFHDTRPTIELSADDALYFNFIAEPMTNVVMWVKDGNRWFEVGQIKTRRKITASLENGKAVLHASVRIRGSLLQDETNGRVPLTDAESEHYQRALEAQVRDSSIQVLHQLQKEQLDLYGFGRYVFVHHPSTEAFIEKKWPQTFADAKPEFDIKVTIFQKGNLL